jgi:O-6-methylguanine DNA methyltransferase
LQTVLFIDVDFLYTFIMNHEATFTERVKSVVRSIPKGKLMTYAAVATAAGSPGAARAVGSIMKANYDKSMPCHRVIRSDGGIGDYNRGGTAAKRALLIKERAIRP